MGNGKDGNDSSESEKVIVTQPGTMKSPTTISLKGTVSTSVGSRVPPQVPKGLGPLVDTTHLFVKQCVEIVEALSGFETANKYEILNSMGQRIYFAVEQTNCCIICCCRTRRCFKFKVTNHLGQPVLYLKRPCSCTCCIGSKLMCDYCGNKIYVTLADGTPLGAVKQQCACCTPKLNVKNANDDTVLKIHGPTCALCCCCRCRLCGSVEFKILDPSEKENQGQISKQWTGFVKEALTDADNYGISFDEMLDPKIKAVLLGGVILIDFMYFEDTGPQDRVTGQQPM